MEIKPEEQVKDKKTQTRSEALMALYPLNLARELVKASLDAEPSPTISEEEVKNFFYSTLGEKLDEIPPPTPEWNAAYDEAEIEREVKKAISQMSISWKIMLHLARNRVKGGDVHLDDMLEPHTPVHTPDGKTWQEASSVGIKLSVEQVNKLHAAFVANLRPLIDSTLDGYALWSEDFVVIKGWLGYCLKSNSKP